MPNDPFGPRNKQLRFFRKAYLNQGVFGNPSDPAKVRGDTEYPDFVGDFESLDEVEGLDNTQSLDIAYQGRLAETETKVEEIKIQIKGTAGTTYQLLLYMEGAITANPVYDSGVLAPTLTLSETTLTSGVDFLDQPTGDGKYFLVLRAFVDLNDFVRCTRPFARQSNAS